MTAERHTFRDAMEPALPPIIGDMVETETVAEGYRMGLYLDSRLLITEHPEALSGADWTEHIDDDTWTASGDVTVFCDDPCWTANCNTAPGGGCSLEGNLMSSQRN